MAAQILAQDRYLVSSVPGVRESRVLGAFDGTRSPVTSTENYALKIAAGYFLYPRHENDSYYFLLRLKAAVQGRAQPDLGIPIPPGAAGPGRR